MNEMKPEDVMRAIAELRKRGLSNGGGLGYHAGWCDEVADLLESVNALLREKDAKIAELQSIAEYQQSSNMKRWFELQEKDKQIAEKDAEIERLRYNLEAVLEERADHSDAIAEFAERLKHTLCINNEENTEFFDYAYTLETIDQIAKEMKENHNERK